MGVYCLDQRMEKIIRPLAVNVVNSNGAGDAFAAGVVYGMINNQDVEQCTKLGIISSSYAITHHLPVNPEINEQKLQQYLANHKTLVFSDTLNNTTL